MIKNNKTCTIICGKSFFDAIEKLTSIQKEEIAKADKKVPIKVDSKTFYIDVNKLNAIRKNRLVNGLNL